MWCLRPRRRPGPRSDSIGNRRPAGVLRATARIPRSREGGDRLSGLELTLRLVAGVVLTLLNAFFVTSEFALTRARQLPAADYQGSRALRLAWRMTNELEIYLTGCQLGISVTSVLLGVVAEPAVTEVIRPLLGWLPLGEATLRTTAVVVAVVVIQLVHKIWGEQAPTYLGLERPRQVARLTAPVLYAFTKVNKPVIYAGDGLAKATLRLFGIRVTRSWTEDGEGEGEAAAEGEARGGSPRERVLAALSGTSMPPDRQSEVAAAVAIDEIPVRRIATPRDAVVVVDRADAPRDVIAKLRERANTRLPLVDGSLDRYLGNLYVPALLPRLRELRRGEVSLEDVAVAPFTLPADLSVAEAIDRLQAAKQELAVLLDADERAVGVVTVTDAFEAIVGELEDPFD